MRAAHLENARRRPFEASVDLRITQAASDYSRVFGSADGIVMHLSATDVQAIRRELRAVIDYAPPISKGKK